MEISSWEISVMSPPLSWLSYIFGTFIHTNPLNSLFADTGSDLWIFTRWSLSFMWTAVAWVLKTHLWCDGISVRGEGRGVFRTWNVLRGGNLTKNKLEFLEFVLWSSTWGQWMTALPLRTTIGISVFFGELKFYGCQISLSIACGHWAGPGSCRFPKRDLLPAVFTVWS